MTIHNLNNMNLVNVKNNGTANRAKKIWRKGGRKMWRSTNFFILILGLKELMHVNFDK